MQSGKFSDPGVLECGSSRGSGLDIVSEEESDKVFSVLGDSLPGAVLEGELTLTNFIHDVLIRLSVEGWHS